MHQVGGEHLTALSELRSHTWTNRIVGSEAICKCMTTLLGEASAEDVVHVRGARSKA